MNSTKPVGEGTFSEAASDGGNTVAGRLIGAASSAVSGGAPGGATGPKTDSIEASDGERPTAKGDASTGTWFGATAPSALTGKVAGGEDVNGACSRAGWSTAEAGDADPCGRFVAAGDAKAAAGDGDTGDPRLAMASAAPAI